MIYGKISSTFELLTEETAIKWRMPYGTLAKNASTATTATSAATKPALAGTPITMSSGNLVIPTIGAASSLQGVLFDTYCSDLDDSQGSGYLTVILGPHVGKTSQVSSVVTAAATIPGTALNISATGDANAGKLTNAGSNGTVVAYAINFDGTYMTYFWVGTAA